MTSLDPRTVIVLAGAMSGLMSLVLLALKRNYPPSIRGLNEWSVGLLILFAGSLLYAGRGLLPEFVSIPVSNFLVWSGLYLTYAGSQRFYGFAPRPGPWMAGLAVALLATVWFTFFEPSYHARLLIGTGMRALLFAVHGVFIFRQGSITFARTLAIGVLATATVTQVLRALSSFVYPLGTDVFNSEPRQLAYLTSSSVLILLFSISLVLMASERVRAELEYLASHDPLTNALTRRHFDEACQRELERCRRHGRHMALLLMDLDHFKAVNDRYGHQAGDRVLINFVAKVTALLRQPDQLARFGGEEFVLLLPETSPEEALAVAGRIHAITTVNSLEPSCSVSIGVTSNQIDSDTVDNMLARADAALYRAKANGRNRTETA